MVTFSNADTCFAKKLCTRSLPNVQGLSRGSMGLQTEGESNPLKFSQMFHLAPQGSSFVVTNGVYVTQTPLLRC